MHSFARSHKTTVSIFPLVWTTSFIVYHQASVGGEKAGSIVLLNCNEMSNVAWHNCFL